jgi:hypothetical protein
MTPFDPTMTSRPRRHWAEVAIDVALMLIAAAAATLLIATAPVGPMPMASAKPRTVSAAAAPAVPATNGAAVRHVASAQDAR